MPNQSRALAGVPNAQSSLEDRNQLFQSLNDRVNAADRR